VSYSKDMHRRLEIKAKIGADAVEEIISAKAMEMRARMAAMDIFWRVRAIRFSAGRLK